MRVTPDQQSEIDAERALATETRRRTVPALEALLFEPIPVLDHGFIRVIDYMGDDAAIVQAARVSYGKGTKRTSEDSGLIRYLMRHGHTSPFEMCEIKLHVKLPIFIARQWIRHRTANVNEYSARYSILEQEFYVPVPDALATQSTTNRQGRDRILSGAEADGVLAMLRDDAMRSHAHYRQMLNRDEDGAVIDPEKDGITRELARLALPLSTYTQWYWKIDLHNFMHFLRLRADAHAQYEIRAYADVLLDVLARWTPMTYAAFRDYRLKAATLSAPALEVIRRMLDGQPVGPDESGLSKREWRELMAILGRAPTVE